MPFLHGKRGNPVILPYALSDSILAGDVNVGSRSFLDAHADEGRPMKRDEPIGAVFTQD